MPLQPRIGAHNKLDINTRPAKPTNVLDALLEFITLRTRRRMATQRCARRQAVDCRWWVEPLRSLAAAVLIQGWLRDYEVSKVAVQGLVQFHEYPAAGVLGIIWRFC
jgi:hypothetical protein